MKNKFLIVLILASSLCQAETLTGVAKNKKGEIVYVEKHEIQQDDAGLNKFIRVEYSKPDSLPFATMTSDFSMNKNVPETTFEDKRFNTKATIRVVGNLVEFEEFKNDKSISKKTLPLNDAMVASQGFDNFIKANSTKLAANPLEFKFGVLDKKDFFSLTGYRKPAGTVDEVEYGIRASNWLIRLFAHELRVIYDLKSMRLKSFVGRSNILDDTGKAQDVAIQYEWDKEK